MKFTAFTHNALNYRRQKSKLEKSGYKTCQPDWEILRGGKIGMKIIDVVIMPNGTEIMYKIGG